MLVFSVASESSVLGNDPTTDDPIEAIDYFVVATDSSGNQWRHTENFSSCFEVVNEVGEVEFRYDDQARELAESVLEDFRRSGLERVADLDDWYEI